MIIFEHDDITALERLHFFFVCVCVCVGGGGGGGGGGTGVCVCGSIGDQWGLS